MPLTPMTEEDFKKKFGAGERDFSRIKLISHAGAPPLKPGAYRGWPDASPPEAEEDSDEPYIFEGADLSDYSVQNLPRVKARDSRWGSLGMGYLEGCDFSGASFLSLYRTVFKGSDLSRATIESSYYAILDSCDIRDLNVRPMLVRPGQPDPSAALIIIKSRIHAYQASDIGRFTTKDLVVE